VEGVEIREEGMGSSGIMVYRLRAVLSVYVFCVASARRFRLADGLVEPVRIFVLPASFHVTDDGYIVFPHPLLSCFSFDNHKTTKQ
jgi:hypothetical protein